MVYLLTVRKAFFLLIGILAVVSLKGTANTAAILDMRDCEGFSERLEEPLDSHTEVRFARYLQEGSFPMTFENETYAARWCYLWEKEQAQNEVNRRERTDFRSRSLQERFDNIGIGSRTPAAGSFPTTDKELTDLVPHRQARVRARLKNRNCEMSGNSSEELEEYAICLKELVKVFSITDKTKEERRLSRLGLRVPKPNRETREPLVQRTGDYTRRSVLRTAEVIQSAAATHQFDPLSIGSIPLDEALENKIRVGVGRHDCSRVVPVEARIRCEWLVQKSYRTQAGLLGRTESRLRALGVFEGGLIRRGVGQANSNDETASVQSTIQTRRLLGGFRPTPRTIQEAQENFQSPVVVPGDCTVDPTRCND